MTIVYILIAALAIASFVAVFIGSRRMIGQRCDELKLELQQQIDALSAEVSAVKQSANAPTPAAINPALAEEITPETLATISETIAALLGKKVRIRSVKTLRTPNSSANPWAQHGRVVVQASRNFSQRRREP